MNTAIWITLIICATILILYIVSCVRDVKIAKQLNRPNGMFDLLKGKQTYFRKKDD